MTTISLWKAISKKTVQFPELTENIKVDVAIVGGGITGVTAAQELTAVGKRVAILEAGLIGENTTGFSTGNLYVPVQPYYQNIVSKFNLETAKAIAHSRQFAIDYIENNINGNHTTSHFARRPWFIYTDDDNKMDFLDKEVETFKKMEFNIQYTDSLPLSIHYKKCAILENQARFNPLQYVIDSGEDLQQKNCMIYENTRVVGIEENGVCNLKTAHGKITADKVIIATHTPVGLNFVHFYTAPYRSYVVGVHETNGYPEGHFWDLSEPHHAICTHAVNGNKPNLLLVAGSHHKTGQDDNAQAHYDKLTNFLKRHFPVLDVAYRWSAQHYTAADDVPYIGLAHRSAKNIYMATGYFADGLVYGVIGGIVLSELIQGKESPLSKIYNANRFTPLASAPSLTKENLNVFLQYLKDFPKFSSEKDYQSIKAGEGKVLEINSEKCAVSRDSSNRLHVVSAVCTHMKGIVNWNNAEKTWDCPCHGSRFTMDGKVIEGPADMDLKKMELP